MVFPNDAARADSSVLRQVIQSVTANAQLAGMNPKHTAIVSGMFMQFNEIETWADLQECLHSKLKATPRNQWSLFVQQSALGIAGGQHEHKS